MVNNIDQSIRDIKKRISSDFPTTIRRSVYLGNLIEVNHCVNRWLFERWVDSSTAEKELSILHKEMAQTIFQQTNNNELEISFVHIDPRRSKQPKQEYLLCEH